MPAYRLNDPRHPTNRVRLLYRAWERAGLIGTDIPMDRFRAMLMVVTGCAAKRALADYQDQMVALRVVEWEKGSHVTPRPDGLALLD